MSNTMDVNFGLSNRMEDLAFHWEAILADGNVIQQFDHETGEERLFKDVQDNFDKLALFFLRDRFGDKSFCVDLKNGIITFGRYIYLADEFLKKKDNIRLIYFRRNIVKLNFNMREEGRSIFYFLGVQYTDNNGHNRKKILQIDQSGNFIVGD